jgi:acyl dehydratase
MRETWLCHALTDWMGDEGWLWKLRCEHRKFNYMGDTTWVRGSVVDKREADGQNEVHIELRCENQRGELTTPASAVVLLPSRTSPRVELPAPPAPTMDAMVRHELERFNVG